MVLPAINMNLLDIVTMFDYYIIAQNIIVKVTFFRTKSFFLMIIVHRIYGIYLNDEKLAFCLMNNFFFVI